MYIKPINLKLLNNPLHLYLKDVQMNGDFKSLHESSTIYKNLPDAIKRKYQKKAAALIKSKSERYEEIERLHRIPNTSYTPPHIIFRM